MLRAFVDRLQAAVALPVAARIELKEFDRARSAVDARDSGFLARLFAGARRASPRSQPASANGCHRTRAGSRRQLRALQVASPTISADLKIDLFAGGVEVKVLDRQALGRGIGDILIAQNFGQPLMVEGRTAAAMHNTYQDEFVIARTCANRVPHLPVVIEPVWIDAVAEDLTACQPWQRGVAIEVCLATLSSCDKGFGQQPVEYNTRYYYWRLKKTSGGFCK
jgi:hypothetical protein